MFQKIKEWVWRLFGFEAQKPVAPLDGFTTDYETTTTENITAVIASRLGTLTIGSSSPALEGDGLRHDFLQSVLSHLWEDLPPIVSQSWGKGGKVLIPLVSGSHISVAAIDQSRVTINQTDGGRITSATVLAQTVVQNHQPYHRLMTYALQPDGVQTITQTAVNQSGVQVSLSTVPAWADLGEPICITGTDRLLIGWIKCPRDSRKEANPYGVPITYGAMQELTEIAEHLAWYRREFKLARPMLGLSETLWKNPNDMDISAIKRTVQDDDSPFIPIHHTSIIGEDGRWQHFAPNIRQEAFEGRLTSLYRRLEKACGLSQGILTERQQMSYATKDEVRSAMYDTFALLSMMRKSIEIALHDVLYASDVLAEHFALTPCGSCQQWSLSVDWDMSLLESTSETFTQLSELQSRGLITKGRLVSWVLGIGMQEAQDEVSLATDEQPSISLEGLLHE